MSTGQRVNVVLLTALEGRQDYSATTGSARNLALAGFHSSSIAKFAPMSWRAVPVAGQVGFPLKIAKLPRVTLGGGANQVGKATKTLLLDLDDISGLEDLGMSIDASAFPGDIVAMREDGRAVESAQVAGLCAFIDKAVEGAKYTKEVAEKLTVEAFREWFESWKVSRAVDIFGPATALVDNPVMITEEEYESDYDEKKIIAVPRAGPVLSDVIRCVILSPYHGLMDADQVSPLKRLLAKDGILERRMTHTDLATLDKKTWKVSPVAYEFGFPILACNLPVTIQPDGGSIPSKKAEVNGNANALFFVTDTADSHFGRPEWDIAENGKARHPGFRGDVVLIRPDLKEPLSGTEIQAMLEAIRRGVEDGKGNPNRLERPSLFTPRVYHETFAIMWQLQLGSQHPESAWMYNPVPGAAEEEGLENDLVAGHKSAELGEVEAMIGRMARLGGTSTVQEWTQEQVQAEKEAEDGA